MRAKQYFQGYKYPNQPDGRFFRSLETVPRYFQWLIVSHNRCKIRERKTFADQRRKEKKKRKHILCALVVALLDTQEGRKEGNSNKSKNEVEKGEKKIVVIVYSIENDEGIEGSITKRQ